VVPGDWLVRFRRASTLIGARMTNAKRRLAPRFFALAVLGLAVSAAGCDLYLDPDGIDAALEKVAQHIDPASNRDVLRMRAAPNPFGDGVIVTIQHSTTQGTVLVLGDEAWALDEATRTLTPSLPLFDAALTSARARFGLTDPGAADRVRSRMAVPSGS
jgi:hypothetical protein